jgi:hypothetical protein
MNEDELEQEFRTVATEVLLSDDMDEGAGHIRKLATRVAQRMSQVNANQRVIDKAFRDFMAEHAEDLLDDPVLLEKVKAREQYLIRAAPGMASVDRWHRAANDVRQRYGDANQRVIRGMRQQRFGARLAGDTESYQFDTGADDPNVEPTLDEDEATLAADRVAAIYGMQEARKGHPNKVDKARYAEMELRRRQRGGR